VYRKTIGKRVAATLKKIRQKLRARLHEKTKDIGEWLGSVVRGYFGYHAAPRNEYRQKAFRHEVLRMWWWQLRRRSQRSRWSWERCVRSARPVTAIPTATRSPGGIPAT
jgi:RNA-directed DNA polymerase